MRSVILEIGTPEKGLAIIYSETVEGPKDHLIQRFVLRIEPAMIGGNWFTRTLRRIFMTPIEVPLVECEDDRYMHYWYSRGQFSIYSYDKRHGQRITRVDLDAPVRNYPPSVTSTEIESKSPPQIVDISNPGLDTYLMIVCEDEVIPDIYLISHRGELHEGVVSDITHIGSIEVDFTIEGEEARDLLVNCLGDRYTLRINMVETAAEAV
jgi:hypothetical protein